MAKSFWQRGEDYAKKVSSEIIDQIKAGVAPWQKPWKPGEQTARKLLNRQEVQRRQQPLPDEPGDPRWPGDNRWGTYNQIREAGGQVRKGEKGTQVLSSRIATAGLRRTRKGRR